MKSKLKAKLKEENPPKVTISTDGWTQRHDAFLGINGYYIDKNWIRKKINLACSVFNTEHTGINIYRESRGNREGDGIWAAGAGSGRDRAGTLPA